ncbi:hypothetical protein C8Q79DRAFT_924759 [Trametes meyenii]|nr:hypothetical protein C8Q79DRAFT_924759 [Trametes meyenii]
MFAMWSRNWYLGSILFLMGLVNPSSITVLNALAYRAVPGPPNLVACVSYLGGSSISLYPVIIVYELTCLALTAFKTFSLWREQRSTGMSTRFTSMLLRDAAHVYVPLTRLNRVMSTLSLLNIISVLIPVDVQVNAVYSRV